MKLFNVCLGLLFCISVSSCFKAYKKVEPKAITPEPQKLVVISFIDPFDTVLQVFVARSQSAFSISNLPELVPNASVIISNGSKELHFKRKFDAFTDSTYDYLKKFAVYEAKPDAGFIHSSGQYFLIVTTSHGETAKSSCRIIPNEGQIFDIRQNTIDDFSYYSLQNDLIQMKRKNLHFSVRDHQSANSFYSAKVLAESYDTSIFRNDTIRTKLLMNMNKDYQENQKTYPSFSLMPESFYTLKYYSQFSNSPFLHKGIEGGVEVIYGYRNSSPPKALVLLSRVDESYHKFHKTMSDYTEQNFISEPTKVFSNIENGFGVFAAKNTKIIRVD